MGTLRGDIYENALRIRQLHGVFLTSRAQNPSQWCDLIKGYLSLGFQNEALRIYTQALPNRTQQPVLALILKACASLCHILLGKSLHSESVKVGLVHDVMVGTAFISMYSKCRNIVNARKLFDEMPVRNEVTYNAMIGGYTSNGGMNSAMALFDQLPNRTPVSWATMIEGFAVMCDSEIARALFERIPLEMRTVVTWTVMVNCYTVNGQMDLAREMFDRMPIKNVFVWSSMIRGYFKKGNMREARDIFDRAPVRNLVVWNALIAGYTQLGCCDEALNAYRQMQESGFVPDEFTVASILSACAQTGDLELGKEVHELITRRRIRMNVFVLNGLVDMYAKCGDLDTARRIFESIRWKNDSCWNTMISGLASHGLSEEALKLFARMEMSSEKPNGVTFLGILSACTHGGLVKDGLNIFAKMIKCGVERGIEHYGCLVDLLGRAGMVVEAYNVIMNMPMRPNEVVWGALLGACRVHMDTDSTSRVTNEVDKLNNGIVSNIDLEYMDLSNIYAALEKWEESKMMRKTPGRTSVVVANVED